MDLNRKIVFVSVSVGVLCILYATGSLRTLFLWVSCLLCCIMGTVGGASLVICSGKIYKPERQREDSLARLLLVRMMERATKIQAPDRKVVMSVNLDLVIQDIFNLVVRDYVMSWYSSLGKDEERFKQQLQKEVWHMLEQFTERMTKIDKVHFMTKPVVHTLIKHFKRIRLATAKPSLQGDKKQKFFLHPWLSSEERELEFLRKVADVFLIYLLPKSYSLCPSVRHLLREILACKVVHPAIDLFCDPDYFNQKVFDWLDYRDKLAEEHKRTYTYAATYEEFMTIIDQCSDIEHLKQLRYNIISEIMQATTIQNLKRAKGLDIEKETVPAGSSKGDLLKARNLKRYLNQLTIAKIHCEKRINLLGGPDYKSYTADIRREEHENMPGKKILAFKLIMENANARNHLLKYLHKSHHDALLRFWTAVENMKQSQKKHWHEMASEIYQMFITHPTSLLRTKLSRAVIKNMESFMMGNKGPEAFYEAQNTVYHALEEEHYASFILSDIYHKYITSLEEDSVDSAHNSSPDSQHSPLSKKQSDLSIAAKLVEHSTYAQQKLQTIDEKILNKSQAVKAMKSSQKPDPKIKKLQVEIEEEIEKLKTDRRQLEFHIDRTEVWAENVGKWKAHIYNSEVVSEDNKVIVYFVIVIHLSGATMIQPHGIQGYTQGWVVSRKLADFQALHQQLLQMCRDLDNIDIPHSNKRMKSGDTEVLDKAKDQLGLFLHFVLMDERLAQSEPVFAFFSPSPEHLKQPPTSPKKKTFSLSNLFKGMSGTAQQDSDSDDELLFIDEEELKEEHGKDSIAKPMYVLIGEVFELQGVFKWLRKTLMAFVKVTFGRSINIQIHDTVAWIVSEPMMIYYLEQFRNAYWPDGKLAEPYEPKTDEEKLRTRLQAKEKLLNYTTEGLKGLVGEHNARTGSIKVFEAMQDARLNKHLFYELLEELLFELFPELLEHRSEDKFDHKKTSDTDSLKLQQQTASKNMISGF